MSFPALWRRRYLIAYLALAAWLVQGVARSYDPRTGWTALIVFGDSFAARRLPELRDTPIRASPSPAGYDGQFYAQLAVAGNPFDPGLRAALDLPAYRARRILLPLAAHLAGLGRPGWVLGAYALSNLLGWLVLALLLALWWFPPTDLHNLLRWSGTLFGAGMLVSVMRGLTDGPALLLVAAGVRCVEKDRRWLGAGLLAASGLTRETSALASAACVDPTERDRRRLARMGIAALACVLPVAVWAAVLFARAGELGGTRNFAWPLAALGEKIGTLGADARTRGFDADVRTELWALAALAVQVASLAFAPRPAQLWWRVGAAFGVLFLFLGDAVWEGTPSAACRVLLPLTLAFNVLAPRTRSGLALLVAGNLTVLSAAGIVSSPG